MTDRATVWSITWYPPTDSMSEAISKCEIEEYAKRQLPPGWKLKGQMEQCPETLRYHFQGMLKTPQTRFGAVQRMMDKAHIEAARNKDGLAKYVEKEESRVAKIDCANNIPTLFEYQTIIAEMWVEEEFKFLWQKEIERPCRLADVNEVAMSYIDSLVEKDIEEGRRGAEFIAINPMWRASWKKFWRVIINRHASSVKAQSSSQADEASPSEDAQVE